MKTETIDIIRLFMLDHERNPMVANTVIKNKICGMKLEKDKATGEETWSENTNFIDTIWLINMIDLYMIQELKKEQIYELKKEWGDFLSASELCNGEPAYPVRIDIIVNGMPVSISKLKEWGF